MAAALSSKSLCWIPAKGGASVPNAIVAGTGADGAELHIARAPETAALTPGKLQMGYKGALIPFYEQEHFHIEYEILANPSGIELVWEAASGGHVPTGAVKGGWCDQNKPSYIARVTKDDENIPCKLVPRCGLAFVGCDGKELEYKNYEVLCVKSVEPDVVEASVTFPPIEKIEVPQVEKTETPPDKKTAAPPDAESVPPQPSVAETVPSTVVKTPPPPIPQAAASPVSAAKQPPPPKKEDGCVIS